MRTNSKPKPILRIMLILGIAVQTMFTACGGDKNTFTDPRDGKKYKFATIGGQTWMAENLNYEADSSKCYNDSTAYCEKYGRLYNWETAVKACPDGWHLPSKMQWEELYRYADSSAKYLKAKSSWENTQDSASGNGEDKFGFAALPGGNRNLHYGESSRFDDAGSGGYWWNATALDDWAYYGVMRKEGDWVSISDGKKTMHNSVRCIKESICNEKPYNAATHFCLNGTDIAERCGDSEYNPETQFCRGKDAIERCGGKEYDPATQNCVAGEARAYKTVKIGKYTWMAAETLAPQGGICPL